MIFFLKSSGENKYIRIACISLGLIATLLIMVWARAFYGSIKAYETGETCLKEGRYIRAITFFDRSIHWYTPLNPYIEKSAERLWQIGEHAEERGDTKLALIAYRAIRRGFYAASHFITPGREWIEKCDSRIRKLVRLESQAMKRSPDFESKKKRILESQKTVPPDVFWSVVLEIGFLGWIGSVIGFIMFAIRRREGPEKSTYLSFVWIGLAFVFFALWIVGMMKA